MAHATLNNRGTNPSASGTVSVTAATHNAVLVNQTGSAVRVTLTSSADGITFNTNHSQFGPNTGYQYVIDQGSVSGGGNYVTYKLDPGAFASHQVVASAAGTYRIESNGAQATHGTNVVENDRIWFNLVD